MLRFQSTLPMRGETKLTKAASSTSWSFQSTLPVRGEIPPRSDQQIVSIHSPYAGRDDGSGYTHGPYHNFNPLFLHRERRRAITRKDLKNLFQSTLPIRGETWSSPSALARAYISIHSPRAGRDLNAILYHIFMPKISIHSPRAGRDWTCPKILRQNSNFNPLSLCGERWSMTGRAC